VNPSPSSQCFGTDMFYSCLSFGPSSLAIVLSILLRYIDSDCLPLVSSNSSLCLSEENLRLRSPMSE
jgi:hypothetical protein